MDDLARKEKRFTFGRNWARYLLVLTDERILEAQNSLRTMLDADTLEGKSFLDIGSGSGLFSLCAARMGAKKIISFDFDRQSVSCTRELKRRYFKDFGDWMIEQGSVLDDRFLAKLGQWDIVYSWGVLHHTGEMWKAMENVAPLVKKGGTLYIAIYNRQRLMTPVWTGIKKMYVSGNVLTKGMLSAVFIFYFIVRGFILDLIQKQNPLKRYTVYRKQRGMHIFYDWLDWIGGYPFEAAKPEEIFDFFRARGFVLEKLKTQFGNSGCNEFVFLRDR